MADNDVVIVSAVRSAVGRGKKDGALATTHPVELSALVMKDAIARAGIDASTIDDVAWGCAMPEASQGLNVARLSALRAGIPVEVPAQTINRFCSSGLQTVANGAMQIMSGMADVVLAGGVEMMSQVPMSGYHARLDPKAMESYIGMGFTAERVAERWRVSRDDQDAWALRSQQRATAALKSGAFASQIVPVPVERVIWNGTDKHVDSLDFVRDELPRSETTAEGLAKLRPAFKEKGTVTAGKASPYSDGAAPLVLMRRSPAGAGRGGGSASPSESSRSSRRWRVSFRSANPCGSTGRSRGRITWADRGARSSANTFSRTTTSSTPCWRSSPPCRQAMRHGLCGCPRSSPVSPSFRSCGWWRDDSRIRPPRCSRRRWPRDPRHSRSTRRTPAAIRCLS